MSVFLHIKETTSNPSEKKSVRRNLIHSRRQETGESEDKTGENPMSISQKLTILQHFEVFSMKKYLKS